MLSYIIVQVVWPQSYCRRGVKHRLTSARERLGLGTGNSLSPRFVFAAQKAFLVLYRVKLESGPHVLSPGPQTKSWIPGSAPLCINVRRSLISSSFLFPDVDVHCELGHQSGCISRRSSGGGSSVIQTLQSSPGQIITGKQDSCSCVCRTCFYNLYIVYIENCEPDWKCLLQCGLYTLSLSPVQKSTLGINIATF